MDIYLDQLHDPFILILDYLEPIDLIRFKRTNRFGYSLVKEVPDRSEEYNQKLKIRYPNCTSIWCYHGLAKVIQAGDLDALKYLICERNISLGRYILLDAFISGNKDIISFLIRKGCRVGPNDIFHLVSRDNVKILKEALPYSELHGYAESLIYNCCLMDRIEVLEILHDKINVRNIKTLQTACELGAIKIVRYLLKYRCIDPSIGQNCCIRKAHEYGHFNVVQTLMGVKKVYDKLSEDQAIEYFKAIDANVAKRN